MVKEFVETDNVQRSEQNTRVRRKYEESNSRPLASLCIYVRVLCQNIFSKSFSYYKRVTKVRNPLHGVTIVWRVSTLEQKGKIQGAQLKKKRENYDENYF